MRMWVEITFIACDTLQTLPRNEFILGFHSHDKSFDMKKLWDALQHFIQSLSDQLYEKNVPRMLSSYYNSVDRKLLISTVINLYRKKFNFYCLTFSRKFMAILIFKALHKTCL